MSKINAQIVEHQVPVQLIMRLQRGRWSLATATAIRIYNFTDVLWSSHARTDDRWVEMVSPPPDPFEGQRGYWVEVDGEMTHFLGSTNVSNETMEAWKAMVRAVREQYGDDTATQPPATDDARLEE